MHDHPEHGGGQLPEDGSETIEKATEGLTK
jgi:hypothetical protein